MSLNAVNNIPHAEEHPLRDAACGGSSGQARASRSTHAVDAASRLPSCVASFTAMTETTKTVTVGGEDGSLRLDRWFKRHYPALAHGRLEKLLRTGHIRV